MSHHDTVKRVEVEGPEGRPILVHPDLVKNFPDRYVPVKKSKAAAAATAGDGSKEA